jgi:hypothetical protein
MRRTILFFIVAMLVGTGAAWAGKAAYKLVMSKDKELCTSVLKLFNEDMKKHGVIKYDKHEMFTRVAWKSVDIGKEADVCLSLQHATLDIDNDGREDLVIKKRACLRSQLSDSLYIFPIESDVLIKLKPGPGGWEPLYGNSNKFDRTGEGYNLKDLDPAKNEGLPAAIAGVFTLQPFIWGKTTYVSMTDLYPEWIVIAKYLHEDKFKDICYFHGPSFKNP